MTHHCVDVQGGSIMLWGCLGVEGNGALHKVDAIKRKENDENIMKLFRKTPARKFKFGLPTGQ